MVDFRPLLFINALALMLLVTAGFASVRKDLDTTDTTAPALAQTVEHATAPETSAAKTPTTRIEAETPAPVAEEPLFVDTRETPLADTPETPQPVDNALPATGEQTETAANSEPFTVEPMPENPEMLAYLEKENAWFEQEMAHTRDLQEKLYQEMTARLDPDESTVPYEKGGYWYYERYAPDQDYPIFARRKGNMDAEEEILVDGNARAEGHDFYDLANGEMSDDQRYLAIAEDFMGRRIHEIRILDTQTGEFLPAVIGNASSSLAWSADGRYLFYLDKHPETLLAYRLVRHELGTDPADDTLVYEEADNTFYNWAHRSRSGDYIMLVHSATDTTEVKILDAHEPLGELKVFLPREKGHEYDVDHANGRFWVRSNWDAINFRVLTTTLENAADRSKWTEVIAHRDDALVSGIQAFDDWLVVGERKDGLRQVRVLAHDGSVDRYLQADAEAYATGVVASAIQANGIEAAQYQIALKQVESLTALGEGTGKQTIIVPADAMEAFGNAFRMLGGLRK